MKSLLCWGNLHRGTSSPYYYPLTKQRNKNTWEPTFWGGHLQFSKILQIPQPIRKFYHCPHGTGCDLVLKIMITLAIELLIFLYIVRQKTTGSEITAGWEWWNFKGYSWEAWCETTAKLSLQGTNPFAIPDRRAETRLALGRRSGGCEKPEMLHYSCHSLLKPWKRQSKHNTRAHKHPDQPTMRFSPFILTLIMLSNGTGTGKLSAEGSGCRLYSFLCY